MLPFTGEHGLYNLFISYLIMTRKLTVKLSALFKQIIYTYGLINILDYF